MTDVGALVVMLALLPALVVPMLGTAAASPALSAPGPFVAGVPTRVLGTGFTRNTPVLVWWDGASPVSARTNQHGALDLAVTVPPAAATGPHEIAASYDSASSRGKGDRKGSAVPTAPTMVARITVMVADAAGAPPSPTPTPPAATPAPPPPSATASPTASAPASPSAAPTSTAPPSASSTPAPSTSPASPALPQFVVATNGSDANAGTTAAPWRTMQHAAERVPAGGTVLIRAGTFAGFRMTRSGTQAAPITFAAYPGERPVIAGSSTVVNVVSLAGVHDVVLRGLVVEGAAADKSGAGIRIDGGSSRVRIEGNLLRENRSYGVSIVDSSDVTVHANEITGNAEGVYVHRAGSGVIVSDNDIHHQDRMVVATAGIGGDDHGGVGIAFVRTTGPLLAVGNRIWGNRAVSPDYGFDGGAFEIYAASNVTVTENVVWDNRNVIETGSDGAACRGNRFTRNVGYGAATLDVSKGLVLRCAEEMLIANNTFHRLDQFVFDIQSGGNFATSVSGLRVLNNVAVMGSGKVYGIAAGLAAHVTVDYNLVYHDSGGVIGSYAPNGSTTSFETFRAWTGFDRHGLNADPRFVDASIMDFRLAPTSPAVDGALAIPGVTTPVTGAAPDIGRHESH